MGGIYWIASYPKSGNTWTRLVIANYRANREAPVDINQLGGMIASSQQLFDNFAGLDASELTPTEIERYRPRLYSGLAAYQAQDVFIKIHDAFSCNFEGVPLVPADVTKGVIYLIRNPLDVTVSYAHHRNNTVQDTANLLCRSKAVLCSRPSKGQMLQKLFSWSRHVLSWVDESGLKVHVVRYEDMVKQPEETFSEILKFAGFKIDEKRLDKALGFSSFETLMTQEKASGFNEKPLNAKFFFRKGIIGDWRQEMDQASAEMIIETQQAVMARFGYLDGNNQPVF